MNKEKEKVGFILIIIGTLYGVLYDRLLGFGLALSLSNDIFMINLLSKAQLVIQLIGILLIVINNQKDIYLFITGILVLISPFLSVFFNLWQYLLLGTMEIRWALLTSFTIIPLLFYIFIIILSKRLNLTGKVLTYVYIGIDVISLFAIRILLNSLSNGLHISWIVSINQWIHTVNSGLLIYIMLLYIIQIEKQKKLEVHT